GHDYSEWNILTSPTCTEMGSEFRICRRTGCTLLEKRVSEALGHDLTGWTITETPTCTADGEETLACKRSGCRFLQTRSISAPGHCWDSGVVTAVPTAQKDGKCRYTCLACGTLRTEILPYLVLPGDVNGDGTVTPADAELLAAYFAGHSCETILWEAADVDGIPGVTRADAMFLARCLAGWPGYELP
ncbi:MAG: dockerin type I repeat-containing protein, partial [Clostridia bacterium]|nr:dockerin type I repeat-containing protein [Clostridia bacterium]